MFCPGSITTEPGCAMTVILKSLPALSGESSQPGKTIAAAVSAAAAIQAPLLVVIASLLSEFRIRASVEGGPLGAALDVRDSGLGRDVLGAVDLGVLGLPRVGAVGE